MVKIDAIYGGEKIIDELQGGKKITDELQGGEKNQKKEYLMFETTSQAQINTTHTKYFLYHYK